MRSRRPTFYVNILGRVYTTATAADIALANQFQDGHSINSLSNYVAGIPPPIIENFDPKIVNPFALSSFRCEGADSDRPTTHQPRRRAPQTAPSSCDGLLSHRSIKAHRHRPGTKLQLRWLGSCPAIILSIRPRQSIC